MTKPTSKSKTKPPIEKAELVKLVLNGIGNEGLSLTKACAKAGIARTTFREWVDADAALSVRYARARDDLIERLVDETLSIADTPVGSTDSGATDTGAVQKQRLQVDTRKWLLSKLAPKKYGDKLELSGDADNPVAIQRIERVIVK